MNCSFAEVSVLEDRGIDALFDLVIDKCMILHNHIQQTNDISKDTNVGNGFKLS